MGKRIYNRNGGGVSHHIPRSGESANLALGLESTLSTRPEFVRCPERDIIQKAKLFYRSGLQSVGEIKSDRRNIKNTPKPIYG